MYGLCTGVNLFHGVRVSSVLRYFVGVNSDDSNSITDETTQTEQLPSDEQALHKPTTLTQIRERSTQTRGNFRRREVFLFLGLAGNLSCFFNGFLSLDPHQLD
jgi:hypothetical protein